MEMDTTGHEMGADETTIITSTIIILKTATDRERRKSTRVKKDPRKTLFWIYLNTLIKQSSYGSQVAVKLPAYLKDMIN